MKKIIVETRYLYDVQLEEYLNNLDRNGWRIISVNILSDHNYQIIKRKKKSYDA